MTKLFLTLLAFLVLMISHVKAEKYAFSESYKVSSPLSLSINMGDGDVTIMPGEENEVELQYFLLKNGEPVKMSKEELVDIYDISITEGKGMLEIFTKSKMKNNTKNWKNHIHLSLVVKVPANALCTVTSGDGDIAMEGLTGEQFCKTSDGDIAVVKNIGTVELHTGDGDVAVSNCIGGARIKTNDGDIAMVNQEGKAEVITGDGDIAVVSMVGNLIANTTDGDISISNLRGGAEAKTSDGDISISIVEVKEALSFETTDGDISLKIPERVGIDLEMRGDELKADFKDFSGDVSDEYIYGKINGGGVPVSIKTDDGTIRLAFE